jgi:hypothetical protein
LGFPLVANGRRYVPKRTADVRTLLYGFGLDLDLPLVLRLSHRSGTLSTNIQRRLQVNRDDRYGGHLDICMKSSLVLVASHLSLQITLQPHKRFAMRCNSFCPQKQHSRCSYVVINALWTCVATSALRQHHTFDHEHKCGHGLSMLVHMHSCPLVIATRCHHGLCGCGGHSQIAKKGGQG